MGDNVAVLKDRPQRALQWGEVIVFVESSVDGRRTVGNCFGDMFAHLIACRLIRRQNKMRYMGRCTCGGEVGFQKLEEPLHYKAFKAIDNANELTML
jgi:hypothetical protein